MDHNERALSECVALILIAFLVVLVALFIIAAMTGVLTGFLQKSALVAVTADEYETGPGTTIISVYHKQGDLVNINGTSHTAGISEIAFTLTDPSGATTRVHNATPVHAAAWGPGQYIYIYPDSGSYGYSDLPPAAGTALPSGDYTVIITDTKVKILLHSLPVTIT